ncbi:hypothetical protein [Nocardia sp. MW-W600-9]
MTLADRVTGINVMWLRRSVVRVDPRKVEPDKADNFEASFAPAITRQAKFDNAPAVELRALISVETRRYEAVFEAQAVFILGGDSAAPPDQEASEFLRDYGFDYLFGYLRTALADDLRTFGFPPGFMPIGGLDKVKAIDFQIEHPQDEAAPA